MNPYKERLATDTDARTLEEAMVGADIFFGVSAKGAVTPEMVESMAKDPIIFAMANPDPEITPPEAKAVRDDVIIGTGRSDYNNQVNNVLCFPFLFRGALDTHASAINDEMKLAACHGPGQSGQTGRPGFGAQSLRRRRDQVRPRIPHPETLRSARSAARRAGGGPGGHGQRRRPPADRGYGKIHRAPRGAAGTFERDHALADQQGQGAARNGSSSRKGKKRKSCVRRRFWSTKGSPCRSCSATKRRSKAEIKALDLDLGNVQHHRSDAQRQARKYIDEMFAMRQRKGVTLAEAKRLIRKNRNYYGAMMVQHGDADALLSGISHHYPETIRPALEIIGKQEGLSKVHGLYMMVFKKDVVFCADTTVTIEPTAEELAETAILTAQKARHFDVEPRVAMLSFSNFGSAEHPLTVQGQARHRAGQATGARPDGRRRNPGERRPRSGADRQPVPVLQPQRERQRLDLPRPAVGQHLLQAAATSSVAPKPSARS